MAMSEFYGPSNDADSRIVILSALNAGLTMLDTADTYGAGHNEKLIGKILKEWTGEVFVATKFGIVRKPGEYARAICGKPEYVKQACDASLRRLGRETIDLYYAHRIDATVSIEDTVEYLKENIKAVDVILQPDEVDALDKAFSPGVIKGERYTPEGMAGVNR